MIENLEMKTIVVPSNTNGWCIVFPTHVSYWSWLGLSRVDSNYVTLTYQLKAGVYKANTLARASIQSLDTYAVRTYQTPQKNKNGVQYIGWAIPKEYYSVITP